MSAKNHEGLIFIVLFLLFVILVADNRIPCCIMRLFEVTVGTYCMPKSLQHPLPPAHTHTHTHTHTPVKRLQSHIHAKYRVSLHNQRLGPTVLFLELAYRFCLSSRSPEPRNCTLRHVRTSEVKEC